MDVKYCHSFVNKQYLYENDHLGVSSVEDFVAGIIHGRHSGDPVVELCAGMLPLGGRASLMHHLWPMMR